MFKNVFEPSCLYEIMWKNMVERDRPQTKISGKLWPEYSHTIVTVTTSNMKYFVV